MQIKKSPFQAIFSVCKRLMLDLHGTAVFGALHGGKDDTHGFDALGSICQCRLAYYEIKKFFLQKT